MHCGKFYRIMRKASLLARPSSQTMSKMYDPLPVYRRELCGIHYRLTVAWDDVARLSIEPHTPLFGKLREAYHRFFLIVWCLFLVNIHHYRWTNPSNLNTKLKSQSFFNRIQMVPNGNVHLSWTHRLTYGPRSESSLSSQKTQLEAYLETSDIKMAANFESWSDQLWSKYWYYFMLF